MKNQSTNIAVAIILVIALIAGSVVFINNLDDAFSKLEDIDLGAEQTTVSGSVSEPKVEFYVDEENQTGYRTVSDVTYFFKVFVAADMGVTDFGNGNIEPNRYVVVDLDKLVGYSDYTVYESFSHDGVSFFNCGNPSELDGRSLRYLYVSGDKLYYTYTSVLRCENPLATLKDLNTNVFNNSGIFSYEYTTGVGDPGIEGPN